MLRANVLLTVLFSSILGLSLPVSAQSLAPSTSKKPRLELFFPHKAGLKAKNNVLGSFLNGAVVGFEGSADELSTMSAQIKSPKKLRQVRFFLNGKLIKRDSSSPFIASKLLAKSVRSKKSSEETIYLVQAKLTFASNKRAKSSSNELSVSIRHGKGKPTQTPTAIPTSTATSVTTANPTATSTPIQSFTAVPTLTPTATQSPTLTVSNAVQISPQSSGQYIQTAIKNNPAGTKFLIKSGVHRLQKFVPKDGNIFEGENGAILNGAKTLTGFTKSGNYWVINGQSQGIFKPAISSTNYCRITGTIGESQGCKYSEDLYFDGKFLHHKRCPTVINGQETECLPSLTSNDWYFDYTNDKIYLGRDPTGHTVETSVTDYAVLGKSGSTPVKNVTIRNLVFEKYATPMQNGPLNASGSTGWLIESNEMRYNHGAGVTAGNQSRVLGNYVHHNGQIGLKAGSTNGAVFESNESAFNNALGFDEGWEAGGSKFARNNNLSVRCNYVHDNDGPGLWTDIFNFDTLYAHNLVVNNRGIGIFHEISYRTRIHHNVSKGNGLAQTSWLWGTQILMSTSQDADVFQNKVEVSALGGDGIGVIQQNRGDGATGMGTLKSVNNYIHNNEITHLGNNSNNGVVADTGSNNPETLLAYTTNRFDYNRYHIPDMETSRFSSSGTNGNFSKFKANGHENGISPKTANDAASSVDSVIVVDTTPPTVPACPALSADDIEFLK